MQQRTIDKERNRMMRKTRVGRKRIVTYQFKKWGCRPKEARKTCNCRMCGLLIPAGAPVINVRDRGERLVDFECLPCGAAAYKGEGDV